MLWKLYAAKKRSTQQEATVWALEKKTLESYPKSQRETVLDAMKHGVATMTRIKHPKILSVVQPLEESRDSLAFASEPLFTSLKTALSPSCSSTNGNFEALRDFTLTDIEIKYGLIQASALNVIHVIAPYSVRITITPFLLQLTEALHFLHSDCHRLHLNLIPESVVINKYGLWKLAGFEFSKVLDESCNGTNNPSMDSVITVPIWQGALMPACQPALHGCSPEAILQGQVSRASDMFAFGLLICSLYNKGQPLLDTGNDYSAYRRGIKDVSLYFI
ncbi:unnamed protein product [Echinostoma caproni]|uniref:Protein kinase domain-containing protein n=1 Tax=Echinostoma caproni TaxID=27848 RepID=A0A183B208_9TREM|nr:unnamed protein product [Echinostoma caproni]